MSVLRIAHWRAAIARIPDRTCDVWLPARSCHARPDRNVVDYSVKGRNDIIISIVLLKRTLLADNDKSPPPRSTRVPHART